MPLTVVGIFFRKLHKLVPVHLMDEERKKVSLKYRYALGLVRFFFSSRFWLEIEDYFNDGADSEIVCKKGFVLIVEL